ncbi:MAG: DUF1844 domain-containing protein [Deltaproteobacteria bacterium]|nr:DUF1844 domain-containing protein [Deltaproteobacteria bacterium]MBN2671761.1 DUF1844 domain-containing protein [Deltaproteobacteria bacterium]
MSCKCNTEQRPAESDDSDPEFPIDFNTFILSLSSSAAFHLGLTPHPEKNNCCTNLPMAQQTIDILHLLQEKTKNNLTGEEERLLEDIIDNLQRKYDSIRKQCGCL